MMKIALCGKMRSGKDTVAEILKDSYHFKEVKLGHGIGIVKAFLFQDDDKITMSNREIYQLIGQTMRKIDEDVWIDKLIKDLKLSELLGIENHTVVSDVRQQNEATKLKEEGYVVVRVESRDDLRIERINKNEGYDEKAFNHETELSVDTLKADYVIKNNGSLEDLAEKVDSLIKEFLQ